MESKDMSSKYLKAIIIPTAAAFAIALGNSSPLWAKAPATQAADTNNGDGVVSALHSSQAVASDRHLAMMDDMEKMEKMEKKGGMGGMGDEQMKGNMPSDGSMPNTDSSGSMQDPMAAPSSSDMMGGMRGSMQGRRSMSNMAPTARMPGFPGASHLYHVGATGFFLDHPQHIALSTEQQTALNRIKEKALLDRTNFDRRIEDAEQELWTLTAADTPDAAKIETKVRAIEKLRGDQRLAFIRAVGEAGKVLTSDQQAALLGTKPPAGSRPTGTGKPAPMAPMAPMPQK
jgi:Spy/CpxP family protein refolding chaperone